MHPHRLADTLEELLANGTELSRAERRSLLYPLAAHSPTIHLWLRWTNAFTPVFTVALLLLLAGMLTALAGVPPTLAVLILQAGTALLAALAITTWRTGWQALLILAATQTRQLNECQAGDVGDEAGRHGSASTGVDPFADR